MADTELRAERRIAIAIVKILRKYFDDYLWPDGLVAKSAEINLQMSNASNLDSISMDVVENFKEAAREMFAQFNDEIDSHLSPVYDSIIVRIIGNALEEIENILKTSLTEEDLIELSEVIDKVSVQKLLRCFTIADNLKKHTDNLMVEVQNGIKGICENTGLSDRMMSMLADLMKKYGVAGDVHISHDFFGDDSDKDIYLDKNKDDRYDDLEYDDYGDVDDNKPDPSGD